MGYVYYGFLSVGNMFFPPPKRFDMLITNISKAICIINHKYGEAIKPDRHSGHKCLQFGKF